MKRIVASLSLAALLLGGTAAFAHSSSPHKSKPVALAASRTTATSKMTVKKHKKHGKRHQAAVRTSAKRNAKRTA